MSPKIQGRTITATRESSAAGTRGPQNQGSAQPCRSLPYQAVERSIHLAPPVRYSSSIAETRATEVVEDYPHNVIVFDRRFDSEEECAAYLVSLRWPQGFAWPECGGRRAWRRTRLAMLSASCRRETSIMAGTLLEKTHKPLQVWFKAMWWVTSQKTGASALGLQRTLGPAASGFINSVPQ